MPLRTLKLLKRYASIIAGAILLASGVTMFLAANQIVSGGTPGMAILLHHFTDYPIGVLMFAINVPLVLMSVRFIGWGFTLRTLLAVTVSSATADLLLEVWKLGAWSREPILAAVAGGVLIGVGLGFIIAGSASAGGPSIIARIIAQRTHLKEADLIIALDALIVTAAGLGFASVDTALWSLVSVYASARALDMMRSGRPSKKVIHISSNNVELLRRHLMHKLGKEGIIVRGLGFDLEEERRLLMLVVDNSKLQAVRKIVETHDREGLMIVMEASELLGRGH